MKKFLTICVVVIFILSLVILGIALRPGEAKSDQMSNTITEISGGDLCEAFALGNIPSEWDDLVIEEIFKQSAEYGVDSCIALRIAKCESTFGRYENNPSSTAKGIYQFTDPTWKFIKAPGHQYDFKENVHQFMVWYPVHPEWWECQ